MKGEGASISKYSPVASANTDGQKGDAFKKVKYFSVNLLNSPDPRLMYGVEYIWGERKTEDGQKGELDRLQASVRYNF